jgi:hypothetical protein
VIAYRLIVTDQPGQPARVYDADATDLAGAIVEADRWAARGFVGGTVKVIDASIDHPDHNVVHVAVGR